ncbi:hypothetical protein UFOVP1155_61 [uncultured Caudovirales phage]|uniref:Uncharacterized protein n=1 Tax=uncultured Caudovirales phage TaxID=2100421 RepID=A0A6J5QSU7_9CAUD|nr:hypothetical protein UFOVP1155_61 [uncultured Caudovirales phage]
MSLREYALIIRIRVRVLVVTYTSTFRKETIREWI